MNRKYRAFIHIIFLALLVVVCLALVGLNFTPLIGGSGVKAASQAVTHGQIAAIRGAESLLLDQKEGNRVFLPLITH